MSDVRVEPQPVTFRSEGVDLAGHLRVPMGADWPCRSWPWGPASRRAEAHDG